MRLDLKNLIFSYFLREKSFAYKSLKITYSVTVFTSFQIDKGIELNESMETFQQLQEFQQRCQSYM